MLDLHGIVLSEKRQDDLGNVGFRDLFDLKPLHPLAITV